MDRVFRQREDWFEVGISPAIRRRTIVGALAIGLCIAAWHFWGSWIPLVVATIVVAERTFEFAYIPKTKKIVSSLIVRANENGLALGCSDINGSLAYPWSTLSYSVEGFSDRPPEVIWIEDRARKNSKQKLVGYEGMGELVALIESNAKQ